MKRARILSVVLSLGIWLGLSAPLQAQQGALEGEVRDQQGKLMPEATISINRTDIAMHFETKTDKKGYYVYMGLPAGNARYDVGIVKDGQTVFQLRGIRVELGGFTRLDINLKEEMTRQQTEMTEEQKKQVEEYQRAVAADKSLRENFDLGRKLLEQPTAENVCSTRCPAGADQAACLSACQAEVQPNAPQVAYKEAAAAFERAAEADPTQFAVWANLGRAYQLAGEPERGIQAYRKAAELKPEEAGGIYNNMGQLLAKAGRVEEATQAFEQAATLDPKNAGMYYLNLGVIFYNAGNLQAAIEPFRKVTQAEPNRAEAHYFLGMCLFNQAEYKAEGGNYLMIPKPGTVEAFQKYLELEPNGRFAKDAQETLTLIEQSVPAELRMRKKK